MNVSTTNITSAPCRVVLPKDREWHSGIGDHHRAAKIADELSDELRKRRDLHPAQKR